MRRREFIASMLGGAAALQATASSAQQGAKTVIGFLHPASPEQTAKRLDAFRRGLEEAGFVEGKNLTIEYRWGQGHSDRLAAMAVDLVRQQVAAICAPGSLPAAFAAKNASSTIPIVFATGGDPVAAGLVKSLSRPGGNVTGVSSLNAAIASKRLELLHQLAPDAKRYFALINPTSPLSGPFMRDVEAGASKLGIRMEVLHATNEKEIEAAFASLPSGTGNALLSSPEPVLYSLRSHIAELAMRTRIPTAFDTRDYVESGGLLSYGADFFDAMQRAGGYVARILRGEKPADLPVVQSEKFELAINLRTARALGIVVPANLLALADDVVE